MRSLLGFLFVLCATVALTGCTSRNLAYDNGRDGGGGAPDLGRPAKCVDLDEATCLSANIDCVADYCTSCDCNGNTFVGCREPQGDPNPCPACAESGCEGCWMFSEAECGKHADCAPVYCESDCALAPTYVGCFGPNEGAPFCPPDDCISPACRKSKECPDGQFCKAPDQTYCPGIIDEICNSDDECGGGGLVCQWLPSECVKEPGFGQCVPKCTSVDDCGAGKECTSDGHCRWQACGANNLCPAQFTCRMDFDDYDQCRRKQCVNDTGCDGGFCVDSLCYAGAGMCTWLPD